MVPAQDIDLGLHKSPILARRGTDIDLNLRFDFCRPFSWLCRRVGLGVE